MSTIHIISLFSFSMVLSKVSSVFKVSCSYFGGRYQASTRKDLLNLCFTSMHNISRLSVCKSVRCSKSIVSLTYMATPPPCLFLSHRSNEKSLRAILELSILLSSFVSLIAIISILFSTTQTSISSLYFTMDYLRMDGKRGHVTYGNRLAIERQESFQTFASLEEELLVCSGLLGPYKISHCLIWGKMTRAR